MSNFVAAQTFKLVLTAQQGHEMQTSTRIRFKKINFPPHIDFVLDEISTGFMKALLSFSRHKICYKTRHSSPYC